MTGFVSFRGAEESSWSDRNTCAHNTKLFLSAPETSTVNENTNTLIINQQMSYIKFHIKTLKIAPTCFDPKIILRELRCSLLKSF